MKIQDIQVDGFGVWKGLTIESLSREVTVFYGQNEAGKTTLMQFVRSMMFGFSEERLEKYFPPVYGGQPGGAVRVTSPLGTYQIKRKLEDSIRSLASDSLTVTDSSDGNAYGQSQLNQLLCEIDESIFNNVFAIGLREIQELNSLNCTDASEMLYKLTSGLDRVSLIDVMQDLKSRRHRLLADDALRSSKLQTLETQKSSLSREIEELQKGSKRWERLLTETGHLKKESEAIEKSIANLEQQSRLFEIATHISNRWQMRHTLTEQITAIGILPEQGDLNLAQLDRYNQKIAALRSKIEQIKQRGRETKNAAISLPINRRLWAQRSRIAAITEHAPWVESLHRQVDRLRDEVDLIENSVVGEAKGLGNQLNIRTKDVRDLEKRGLPRLKRAAKHLLEQRKKQRQLVSDVEKSEFELMQQQERLNKKLEEGATTGTIEETSKLVTRLRRRIELKKRFNQLNHSREHLKRDIGDVITDQVFSISKLARLGLVFVSGFTLFGFGFLDLLYGGALSGNSNIALGIAMMIAGALCGLVFSGLKFRWQRLAGRSLADFRHQTSALRQQLQRCKTEVKELSQSLPKGLPDLDIALLDAEGQMARLETLAPLEDSVFSTLETVEELKRSESDQQYELEIAQQKWEGLLRTAGLPEALEPLQLKEIIQRTNRIADSVFRLDGLKTELTERTKELDNLRSRVTALLDDSGLDYQTQDITDQLAHLNAEMQKQCSLVRQRKDLVTKYRGLRGRLAKTRRELDKYRGKKQGVLTAAGTGTEDEFRELQQTHLQRSKFIEQRDNLTQQIKAALGNQYDEKDIADLMDQGPRGLEQRWQDLQTDIDQSREAQTKLHEQRGEFSLELKMLGEDTRLDEARLELNAIQSQIDVHRKNWQVLGTSASMLDSIREKYEAKRQPETLKEASAYLNQLTDGKYNRIWTRIAGQELLCDTAQKETLTVQRLSRGTREAVYLSLRLALIGAFAKRGTVLPMVLDDVLVNFDSKRARAAAKLLCEFSKQGHQLLMFTCHDHMAQMFYDMQATVKTLPHHSDVAESNASPAHYAPEKPELYSSTSDSDKCYTSSGRDDSLIQLDIDDVDPDLEYELSALANDQQAEKKLRHELIYYPNENESPVNLSDVEGLWQDSKKVV